MSQKTPEQKVLECVDRGLGSLGESSKQAVYWHLGVLYNMRRIDIPRNPQKFKKSLESIFGLGASILERVIVTEIRSAFDIPDEVESLEQAIKLAMMENK
ncbi:MAG: NitrOD5 domain-containing protein [Nitrososphaerales archaeon]